MCPYESFAFIGRNFGEQTNEISLNISRIIIDFCCGTNLWELLIQRQSER